jgi:hypothetical protein
MLPTNQTDFLKHEYMLQNEMGVVEADEGKEGKGS